MKREKFILSIIKKIETLKDGTIAFAYLDGNIPRTHLWYCICVNDYELYMKDERFKRFRNVWRTVAKTMGVSILFAYCNPSERALGELAEQNNLFLNV